MGPASAGTETGEPVTCSRPYVSRVGRYRRPFRGDPYLGEAHPQLRDRATCRKQGEGGTGHAMFPTQTPSPGEGGRRVLGRVCDTANTEQQDAEGRRTPSDRRPQLPRLTTRALPRGMVSPAAGSGLLAGSRTNGVVSLRLPTLALGPP